MAKEQMSGSIFNDMSACMNIAAISAAIHTHKEYQPFYDAFGPKINGFTGIFQMSVNMAQVMTSWEVASGGADAAYDKTTSGWPEIVDSYVNAVLVEAIVSGDIPSLKDTFDDVIELYTTVINGGACYAGRGSAIWNEAWSLLNAEFPGTTSEPNNWMYMGTHQERRSPGTAPGEWRHYFKNRFGGVRSRQYPATDPHTLSTEAKQ